MTKGVDIDWHDGLLTRHFLALKAVSTLYVVGVIASHFALPHRWVWHIALFFLIAMLFTYPLAAARAGAHVSLELRVSVFLATLGVLGFWFTPWLIVTGIFGHGVWDIFKHRGHGTPFFGWYVNGCVIVDWCYAAALSLFLTSGPQI